MQVDVLNIEGKQTGRSVELPDEIFGIEPNDHVIYLAVKQYQGAQRQGSHKVKTRAEVKGSSKKLHKQKGTGGARKGNLRNPLYKGGGTIFGPKPHKYDIKLNRKVKDLAKMGALAYKAKRKCNRCIGRCEYGCSKNINFYRYFKELEHYRKENFICTS